MFSRLYSILPDQKLTTDAFGVSRARLKIFVYSPLRIAGTSAGLAFSARPLTGSVARYCSTKGRILSVSIFPTNVKTKSEASANRSLYISMMRG